MSKDDDESSQDDGDNRDEGSEDDPIERPSAGVAAPTRAEGDQDRVNQNDEDLVEISATALQSPVGPITGVSIIKTAQLKRRVRKWKFGERAIRSLTTEVSVSVNEDRDLVAFAKRRLRALCGSSENGVVDAPDIAEKMALVKDTLPACVDEDENPLLERGWARRPPNGKMYGAKYIHLYRDDIREMFEAGATDSGDKVGAGRMLEMLKRRYVGRFDLPSEAEIKAEISRLYSSFKRRRASGKADNPCGPKRHKMSDPHALFLEALVDEDPNTKPAAGLVAFRVKFPDSHEQLSDKQVLSKVSALKIKAKKTRR